MVTPPPWAVRVSLPPVHGDHGDKVWATCVITDSGHVMDESGCPWSRTRKLSRSHAALACDAPDSVTIVLYVS
jgi:hypothetical protein